MLKLKITFLKIQLNHFSIQSYLSNKKQQILPIYNWQKRVINLFPVSPQNQMQESPNHMCILLRISNYYLGLTLLQLLMTIIYILTLYSSLIEVATYLQVWIATLILLDLSIKCMSQKSKFLRNRWNIADIFILTVVCVSITISYTHADWMFHNKDNYIGATIMAIRYVVQIYRVLMLIMVSKEIRQLQKYQGMINLRPGIQVQIETNQVIQFAH